MNQCFPSLDPIPFKSNPNTLNQRHLFPHKRNNSSGSKQHCKSSNSYTDIGKKSFEKETLYEKNLQLKSEINKLKSELCYARSTALKKEYEINQKEKVIKNVLEDSNGYYDDNYEKAKDSNIVSKLKKQYNSLKKEIEEKENEIVFLKQNIKNSKLNEYMIENNTLLAELQKMNELYVFSIKENEINQIRLKQMNDIQIQFSRQHFIILSLQGNFKTLSDENRELKEENQKMKLQLTTLKNEQKRLRDKKKNENKNSNINIEYYEKQIQALNKQLNAYKEIFLNQEDNTNNNQRNKTKGQSQINNPISTVNSDKSNNEHQKQIAILQDLLAEALQNKNELESENNRLKKKIPSLSSSSQRNQSNDQLNEITYVLIKSFEANNVSKTVAMNNILKSMLENLEDETQIEKSDLQEQLTKKVAEIINCSDNSNDVNKIDYFIKSLLNSSNNDLAKFVDIFLNVFDNVKSYSERTTQKLLYQLQRKLSPHYSYLMTYYKQLESSLISFFSLRSLLLKGNINLEDNLIEFLIYRMKLSNELLDGNRNNKHKNTKDIPSIFDLNYEQLINILEMKLDNVYYNDANSSNEIESADEIMLSDEQYQKIINGLLIEIQEKMSEKYITSVDELLGDIKPNSKREINIQLLIKKIKDNLGLEMSNIQIYCLYNKIKSNDNSNDEELINIDVLRTEIEINAQQLKALID